MIERASQRESGPDIWASVRALREERGETGAQFGAVIGLSKGKVSELEAGKYAPSLPVALRIEMLSIKEGAVRIDAAMLNDDVARARANCPNGCALIHGAMAKLSASGGSTGQARDMSTHAEAGVR